MLPHLLVLLAVASGPTAAGTESCSEPIAAVMRVAPPSPEWVGVLVLDVTGDEDPEVLIADTDRGGNAGEPWRVYRLDEAGEYRVVGTVFFHVLGFRVEGSRLDTYWRLNAASGHFLSYRVSDDSIEEIERTDLLQAGDPEYDRRWERIAAWRPNLQDKHFAARVETASDEEPPHVICRSLH